MTATRKTVQVIVAGDKADYAVPLTVNGVRTVIPRNVATSIPAPFIGALRDSGHAFTIVSETGSDTGVGEAAEGAGLPGADSVEEKDEETAEKAVEPGDDFDPDAVIVGTVDEVADKIAALRPDQRALVRAAEIDREKPRKGVLAALDAADAPVADA